MPINPDRIKADIDAIAACTDTPGAGATRPTFSSSWRAARDYVVAQLEQVGCKIRVDAAGNVHARPNAISWDAPAWISGSHLDSVPNGGNYDGVVGVVLPLEVMRVAKEDLKVVIPLELVIWAEAEGTTFGMSMLGSRAFTGGLSAEQLGDARNSAGQTYLEAGAAHGVTPDKLATDRFTRSRAIGLIEVHVEQGSSLWNGDCPVGVVTAIAGQRQYTCRLIGAAGHGGSTMMTDRRDALAGAAEVILAMEKLGRELGHRSVITVGRISCIPNALDLLNEEATLAIDFRSPVDDVLLRGDGSIRQILQQVVKHRGLSHELKVTASQAAMELDRQVCAKVTRVASKHIDGMAIEQTTSGALHDAAILAPHVPAAMIFVASRDGVSHHPDEYARMADLVLAGNILFDSVRDRRLE